MDRLQSGSFFIFPTGGENQPESDPLLKTELRKDTK